MMLAPEMEPTHSVDRLQTVTHWDYDGAVERARLRAVDLTPEGARILVVSEGNDRLVDLPGRDGAHFPSTFEGWHAGHNPVDSAVAIAHLEERREAGADYLVIPTTAFWWLDHYAAWHAHLAARFVIHPQPDADCLIVDLAGAGRADAAFSPGASTLPRSGDPGLVSVVVPCFNHARYVDEAIESVLGQTYPRFEIVVVDDGSTDSTSNVAEQFAHVRTVRQENTGLAAARNAGLRASRGAYLVFLDADDRLTSRALATSLQTLHARPDCAFVYGQYRFIAEDGSFLAEHEHLPDEIGDDHYEALLRVNTVGHGGAVMYRRPVVEVMNGFDPAFRACEDYDLYLRIARLFPVTRHLSVIADYRRHESNMSEDSALMLQTSLQALLWQQSAVAGNAAWEAALEAGLGRYAGDYGTRLVDGILAGTVPPPEGDTLRILKRHLPDGYRRLEAAGILGQHQQASATGDGREA